MTDELRTTVTLLGQRVDALASRQDVLLTLPGRMEKLEGQLSSALSEIQKDSRNYAVLVERVDTMRDSMRSLRNAVYAFIGSCVLLLIGYVITQGS